MIYFDYASTTKPSQEVLDIYNKISSNYWFNPSTLYRAGLEAKTVFEQAIKSIQSTLGVNSKVIFTSGATEANNLAILGYCKNFSRKKVITTLIEHPSVLEPFKELERQSFTVAYLPVDNDGIINLNRLEEELKDPEVIFVSVMWVNNILGSIQPIEKILGILKKYPRVKIHVDGVQGLGKLPQTFLKEIDLFTISSHKINGVKGTGVLLYKPNITLQPVIYGAKQQELLRSGTIDVAGACSCAKAIQLAINNQAIYYEKVKLIYEDCYNKLKSLSVVINSQESLASQSPYILNISIPKTNSETSMHYLEKDGIYVGVGSACSSKLKKIDQTIMAAKHSEDLASSFLRLCFSQETTSEEVNLLIQSLERYLQK